MLTTQQLNLFQQTFPDIFSDTLLAKQIQSEANLVKIPANTVICHDGQTYADLPLLVKGLIRVYKMSEQGKEITLYHIGEQESCVFSASTCLGAKEFPAIAQTEMDSEMFVLPEQFVRDWLVKSSQWQQFIFGLVAQRLTDVISVVEEVAFQRMDRRIAKYLIQYAGNDNKVHKTHQDISADIGTAREVVTRILKDLELRKIVHLSRGQIAVLDNEQLLAMSHG